MPNSQNGWPASPNKHDIGVVDLHAGGVDIVGGVKDGPVKAVFHYLVEQFNSRVEQLSHPGNWGYAYRPISGSNTVSNHGSGTAIDLNAPRHPLGKSGTFNSGQVGEINNILAELHPVVRWGGNYTGRKDEMHFEINADAGNVAAVAERLPKGDGGPVPPSPPGRPALRKGSTGEHVRLVQRYLGITVDGIFGDQTDSAVRRYQATQRLTVDGIVGPHTWARIESGLGSGRRGPGSTGPNTRPTLRRGSRGAQVTDLQRELKANFPLYAKNLVVDGDYGPKTEEAVREFQRRSGLTPDGIVGPKTWARLTPQ